MSTTTTSNVLVEPVTQEFEAIFREHSDLVFGTACSITRRGEDADVVQTVFIRLLRSGMPPEFPIAAMREPSSLAYERIASGEGPSIRCLGADGLLHAATNAQDPTARRGRCIAGASDLRTVVHDAYASVRVSPPWWRLVGFPLDKFEGSFRIEGIADDPEHVTKDELKLMLQTLLEDRFKARVHVEAREVDGYVLTVAKSGIKFKETSIDATAGGGAPAAGARGGRGDGGACPYVTTSKIYVRGKCGMGEVTNFLRLLLQANHGPAPIADNTGLMGIYNIDFVLEEVRLSPPPTGTGVRGGGSPQERQFTPPVPKALEEQLGLHLERGKAPAEFVVIDHIEQPTEN